jgi:enamine deaminase RidA (YjgF/YER057c/UK114 family)
MCAMSAEDKARELGLDLGKPSAPAGAYVPTVRAGNLLFVSGQIPRRADGTPPIGKVGDTASIEEGYEAARLCAVSLLSHVRNELGSLDKVRRVVKVTGFVNAVPDFKQQADVVNGASELLTAVFGDAGKHARAAIGVGSLPLGVPVEVEAIFEVQ